MAQWLAPWTLMVQQWYVSCHLISDGFLIPFLHHHPCFMHVHMEIQEDLSGCCDLSMCIVMYLIAGGRGPLGSS